MANLLKSINRDKEILKRKYGHKTSGRSVFLVQEILIGKAKKVKNKKSKKEKKKKK